MIYRHLSLGGAGQFEAASAVKDRLQRHIPQKVAWNIPNTSTGTVSFQNKHRTWSEEFGKII